MVSRPRLWWARLDWQGVKTHPLTGQKIQWSQHNGHRQVKPGLPQQEVANFAMGGLKFHEAVIEGRHRILCFTTPSPDPLGRPPPQKHRLRTTEEARQRWLGDNRQFAPWQYDDHTMAWRGNEAVVIYLSEGTAPQLPTRVHTHPRGATPHETQDAGQLLRGISR